MKYEKYAVQMRQSKRAVIYFVCFFFIDDGSNQWHEHKRGWLFECTITYRLLYSDNVDILVTIFLFGGGGGSSLDLPIPACNIFFCICHSQGWGK